MKIFTYFILSLSFVNCSSQSTKLKSSSLVRQIENFSIKSADGTKINGQIDFSKLSKSGNSPILIFVGGTGLFDRDYDFGDSQTKKDLLFKELYPLINAIGVTTVRFDYRGVRCNMKTAPACKNCKNLKDKYQNYLKSCVNNNVRLGVTPENIRDDIVAVYNYVVQKRNVDKNNILILAHSEGTIHISNLVGTSRIKPSALLMLGMVSESPKAVIYRQMVDRNVNYLATFDHDEDKIVNSRELLDFCKKGGINNLNECKKKGNFPKKSSFTLKELRSFYENQYRKYALEAVNKPDSAPYPNEKNTMASYRWWKMWFTDTFPPIDHLKSFNGKISFNNGDIDSQTPGKVQLGIIKKIRADFNSNIHINIYPGIGHGFGNNPMVGPIRPDVAQTLVKEIDWLLD